MFVHSTQILTIYPESISLFAVTLQGKDSSINTSPDVKDVKQPFDLITQLVIPQFIVSAFYTNSIQSPSVSIVVVELY